MSVKAASTSLRHTERKREALAAGPFVHGPLSSLGAPLHAGAQPYIICHANQCLTVH